MAKTKYARGEYVVDSQIAAPTLRCLVINMWIEEDGKAGHFVHGVPLFEHQKIAHYFKEYQEGGKEPWPPETKEDAKEGGWIEEAHTWRTVPLLDWSMDDGPSGVTLSRLD